MLMWKEDLIESMNGLRAIQPFFKRYARDIATIPIKSDMIKAVKKSCKRYQERMARDNEQSARRSKCDIDCSAAKPHEKQDLNAKINVVKKMLSIAKGMKQKHLPTSLVAKHYLTKDKQGLQKLSTSSKLKKKCVASHCRMLNMIHECDYFD